MPYLLRLVITIGIDLLWGYIQPIIAALLFQASPINHLKSEGALQKIGIDNYQIVWAISIAAQIIWVWYLKRSAKKDTPFHSMRKAWWSFASLIFIIGLLLFIFRLFLPNPELSLLWLPIACSLLLIDILILFWLPTILTAPDQYRHVPPASNFLSSL